MSLCIAVLDEEKTASIEAIANETIEDLSEGVELLQDTRDVIDHQLIAIVKERRKDRTEFFPFDFTALVLVLRPVRL